MNKNTFDTINKIANKSKILAPGRPFFERDGAYYEVVDNQLHIIETTKATNWLSLMIEDINTFNQIIEDNNLEYVVHYKCINSECQQLGMYHVDNFKSPNDLKTSLFRQEKVFDSL